MGTAEKITFFCYNLREIDGADANGGYPFGYGDVHRWGHGHNPVKLAKTANPERLKIPPESRYNFMS